MTKKEIIDNPKLAVHLIKFLNTKIERLEKENKAQAEQLNLHGSIKEAQIMKDHLGNEYFMVEKN